MNEEKKRLENIAAETSYISGIGGEVNRYAFEIIRRHLKPGRVLEVGAAEGALSEKLSTLPQPLDLLDGSEILCGKLRQKFPKTRVFNSLIEDFVPGSLYANIVLSHVLEHVADADEVAARIADWLSPGGRLLVFVPNAMSVHRQVGVVMGMLPSEDALNETDKRIGHRRVFNRDGFLSCLKKAGLHINSHGGYFMKPVSNSQIESGWTDEMLKAFLRLGESYPEIAAEIYAVAEKN